MELTTHQYNIFKSRYALPYEETWEECIERVANHVVKAEEHSKVVEIRTNFYNIMKDMKFIPGGRILHGSGRKSGAMLNCFVLDMEDNRYSIAKAMADMYLISTSGGGVGMNYSKIRPKGAPIQGAENMAPGVVSEIRKIDAIGEQVKCGGERRVALLACLSVEHPDIMDFLHVKLDENELNNHNISVLVTNEFLKAVRLDKMWEFEFGGLKYGSPIKARDIWNLIIENSIKRGEPGILFEDNIKDNFATKYFEKFVSTNPCGEICAPNYGACCLGSINLSNFYDEANNDVNWSELAKTIKVAIRFLDNVISINNYPIVECKTTAEESRRIGLGVMGLHYLLIKLGMKYGKKKSLEFIERLFTTIRNEAFEASIELAQEKGAFPMFDYDKYVDNVYIQQLPPRLLRKMKLYGIRNGVLLTVPPTGTTAQLANVSSGIEPIFAPVHVRKYRNTDGSVQTEIIVDYLLSEHYKHNKSLAFFVSAYDVSPEEHIAVQAAVQQYVDGSISKTINLPEKYTDTNEVSDTIFDYSKYLKGMTMYRQNSRGQEPLVSIKFNGRKELGEYIEKAANIKASETDCATGKCDI